MAHWTSRKIADFVFSISQDFVCQLQLRMESKGISNADLAAKLSVSEGRVSQVLNTCSNPTLATVVRYAKALGMKVAIVIYDDGDGDNEKGPIISEIFGKCWEKQGKPQDFFDLEPQP